MLARPTYSVSFRNLLWIYSIIPICGLIFLLDHWVLNYKLRASLHQFPQDYIILNSVFGLPHILASSYILFRHLDYYQHYKQRISLAAIVIIIGLAVAAMTLSYAVMFFLIVSISAAHLLNQQFGLGNMLCRLSGPLYKIWCWSSIAAAIILFTAMFQRSIYSPAQIELLDTCVLGLIAIHISLTVFWARRLDADNKIGRLFLFGNSAMIVVAVLLYRANYYFLAVLAPRVIHDLTAFYIYLTHDKNRLQAKGDAPLQQLCLKFIWLWPIAFICLAYFLLYQLDHSLEWAAKNILNLETPIKISLALITFLNLFHYYTETFTWGKESPYRNYLAFSR